MNSIPSFDDEHLAQALLVLDHICARAREEGVSVMAIDEDAFSEALMMVSSQPRMVRRKCIRWLNKRHPHLQFGTGGGNA
jgi:hypothetical protein